MPVTVSNAGNKWSPNSFACPYGIGSTAAKVHKEKGTTAYVIKNTRQNRLILISRGWPGWGGFFFLIEPKKKNYNKINKTKNRHKTKRTTNTSYQKDLTEGITKLEVRNAQ